MAKAPKIVPAYEPETAYDVRITRVASVGNLRLLPKNLHTMPGKTLNALIDEHGEDLVDGVVRVEALDAG